MSLKFCYTDQSGAVLIVHAVPKEHLERALGPLTEEEYRNHVLERSIPQGAMKVREIQADDIPTDRTYRDAWCDKTKLSSIDIDMSKVKNILLEKVRRVRNEKLNASDIEFTRAVEEGADLHDIRDKRRALRDCTETLKALQPTDKHINSATMLKQLEDAAKQVDSL